MAAQPLTLNDTPQDLYTAASLDTSLAYTVQNTGDRRAYFWESVASPTPGSIRALYLEPGDKGVFKSPDTGAVWFWSDEPTDLGIIAALS